MMICPDCGEEVKKLTINKICDRCNTRMNQNKYMNKRNGTNKEYIPLIKLKDINPIAYNIAMSRRHKTDIKNNKITTKVNTKNNTNPNKDVRIIYYKKVSDDLEKAFQEANVSSDYIKYKDLPLWINTFISLMSEDENENFILQCKKGEDIFNKLRIVYSHEKENLDWDDIEHINEISLAEKALTELRRPTKELLDYYYSIDPIIEHLREDKELIDLIKVAKEELEEKEKNHNNPVLYSSVESSLISAVNLVKTTDPKVKLYDCTVWCYNLNGNPRKSLFRANNGILAKNEIDAKLKLKQFLNDKFSTVVYNDKDITIKEINSKKEIEDLSRKSCS